MSLSTCHAFMEYIYIDTWNRLRWREEAEEMGMGIAIMSVGRLEGEGVAKEMTVLVPAVQHKMCCTT